MILRAVVANYKGIEYASVALAPFNVLVGPNASGKTTFLEAIDLVQDCLQLGPAEAISRRSPDFQDLTYMQAGGRIAVNLIVDVGKVVVYRLWLRHSISRGVEVAHERLLVHADGKFRALAGKTGTGNDFYKRENGKYTDTFKFGRDKLALAFTPPDLERYPTANALKQFLLKGVRFIQLNTAAMRVPAPATCPAELSLDGSNLARAVGVLLRSKGGAGHIGRWVEHLRYAVPDVDSIGWARREADNAEYLVVKFSNGLECPIWLLSDGTLRMLALTLPAFLPPSPAVYLIEEPENGVHPKALEIIVNALRTIPLGQVFVATHSPLLVQQAGAESLLCFSKGEHGVAITRGPDHSVLKQWNGVPDLGTVFASRVLG